MVSDIRLMTRNRLLETEIIAFMIRTTQSVREIDTSLSKTLSWKISKR